MKYLSVCSGIEAASVAWEPLGWNPVGFSEIEPFPCALLAHRFPGVKNYGDLTQYPSWGIKPGDVDVLIGGTPCQSFSVAGLRGGLADARGNLALIFCQLARDIRPKWIIWENVPGVLSSNGGRDFGSILGALVELGYGVAYRICDAQHFGVPQRRRRVFIVGCLGDWRRASSVLFEQPRSEGNRASSRKAKQKTSTPTRGSTKRSRGFRMSAFGQYEDDDSASTLKQRDYKDATDLVTFTAPAIGNFKTDTIAGTLVRNCGSGSGETQNPAFVLQKTVGALCASDCKGANNTYVEEGKLTVWRAGDQANSETLVDLAGTLNTNQGQKGGILFQAQADVAGTLDANYGKGTGTRAGGREREIIAVVDPTLAATNAVFQPQMMQVRRLTPTECERLQGFPDGWTNIPFRNKPAADGPRYKALGNSMAVPVIHWLGKRIDLIERLEEQRG